MWKISSSKTRTHTHIRSDTVSAFLIEDSAIAITKHGIGNVAPSVLCVEFDLDNFG